ncbi:hypothetical protein BDW74DRAFT_92523 [Aspergillus multicolor]|uniref:uncharacterized protein n=1 Tax=Aspergillus multicolor TaxID=41759 RepID=UPI003CCD52F5
MSPQRPATGGAAASQSSALCRYHPRQNEQSRPCLYADAAIKGHELVILEQIKHFCNQLKAGKSNQATPAETRSTPKNMGRMTLQWGQGKPYQPPENEASALGEVKSGRHAVVSEEDTKTAIGGELGSRQPARRRIRGLRHLG